MLQIKNGAIIRSHTLELKKKLDETDEELLTLAIVELRERFKLYSREIIVPFTVELGENFKITIPKSGDKKQLLDRKSTRLNSSHVRISYAVFCLKKKKTLKTYLFVQILRHQYSVKYCSPLPAPPVAAPCHTARYPRVHFEHVDSLNARQLAGSKS